MSCVTFGNEYQNKSLICDDFIIFFQTINLLLIIIIINFLFMIRKCDLRFMRAHIQDFFNDLIIVFEIVPNDILKTYLSKLVEW